MAMSPFKRAVAVTGTYKDRSGQEKKRYTTVGTLFQYDDGGFALKLDSVPVGDGWNGFISFYDIEERQSTGERQAPARAAQGGGGNGGGSYGSRESFSADLDDEIPFITSESLR